MNYQSTDHSQNVVQNYSEPIQNDSEREKNHSVHVRNLAEVVPNKDQEHSEELRNNSESSEKSLSSHTERVPNNSENVRNSNDNVPNSSEAISEHSETLPKKERVGTEGAATDTERVRNTTAEQYRTAPMCSDQYTGCSITVRAAARIFEEAGVPRTERAITNWCNRNARGIIRLDCCYNNEERKYYITPESIDRVIKEERKKFQYIEFKDGNARSMEAEDDSEALRNEETTNVKSEAQGDQVQSSNSDWDDRSRSEQTHRTADTTPPEPHSKERLTQEHIEDDRARLKELQIENYELRVQMEGQKHLIRQFDSLVDGERERHEREKLALVDRLTDARHQVGSLEQRLLQLEASNAPVRDAETEERENLTHAVRPAYIERSVRSDLDGQRTRVQ